MQIQLFGCCFCIFAVHFKEIAHLIQNNIIPMVMLDVVVIPNCFGLFCNRHFRFRETHSCHRHRNSAKPCVFPLDLSILRLFAFCKVAVLCN